MGEKLPPLPLARRKENRINQAGTITFLIPLDNVFIDAVEDDEATLSSSDGEYNRTLKVSEAGKKEDDEYLRLTFRGVKAGKKYTLTYDTKEDADGTEVTKMILFARKISLERSADPICLDQPFEDAEEAESS
jgi:hypothetical protein